MISDNIEKQSSGNAVSVKIFDFIDLHPSTVKHIFSPKNSDKIYISREHYSQIYCYQTSKSPHKVLLNQLCRLQHCQYLFQIDGVVTMLMPFQLRVKRNGIFINYPFTTQLISVFYDEEKQILNTFHEKQAIRWYISKEDGVQMKYYQKLEAPYHITQDGCLEGYGKKVKPPQKDTFFTVMEISKCKKYIFIGCDNGALYIYQTKFLTNIKAITRHEASILSIKVFENVCYFSGSDSKVSSLRLNQNTEQWILSNQFRGQSHDITTLAISPDQQYLISAGLTTDLCFYQQNLQLNYQKNKKQDYEDNPNTWSHKVSYSSEELVISVGEYLIINKYRSFQIWKTNKQNMKWAQFLVKYQLPFHKNIKIIKAKVWDNKSNTLLIIVATQYQAVTWSFNQNQGLLKYSTITNPYTLLEFINNTSFLITLREGYKLQKLDYKTGQIVELTETSIDFPTSLRVIQQTEKTSSRILLASKYSKQIDVYEHKSKLKSFQLVKTIKLSQFYETIDFINNQELLIKYFGSNILTGLSLKSQKQQQIITLPIKKIRYGGWIKKHMSTNNQTKLFWYGVGEGKIILVSNLGRLNSKKTKKIRVKQFPRIGTVTINQEETQWNMGVIPLNFHKHIKENVIKPVITKKIQ